VDPQAEYLAGELARELGDQKPESVRTFRRLAMAVPHTMLWRAVGEAKLARVDGRIRGNVAAFFVGVVKKLAAEANIPLPFKPSPVAA
jgi:hypothetical protein